MSVNAGSPAPCCRPRDPDVVAREATGADADRIWAAARAPYRGYRTYPARTHGRTIRVFLHATPIGRS